MLSLRLPQMEFSDTSSELWATACKDISVYIGQVMELFLGQPSGRLASR